MNKSRRGQLNLLFLLQTHLANKVKNGISQAFVKKFNIKQTAHIAKIKENVNPGNDKNMEKEDEPNTAGRQENNDNTSKEVIEKVKLLKVHDTTMDPDKTKPPSPYSDIVNVSTSFD